MIKRISVLLFMALFTLLSALTAFADIGPKPSVSVNFTGAEDKAFYATLLSKDKSTGPASAWDGKEGSIRIYGDMKKEIWEKFVSYEDSDGYYFLQEYWDCTEEKELRWGYFPPSPFKILVYFPENDEFSVSGIYERYAFDSYFTVNLAEGGSSIKALKSYDYTWETISLVLRIVITIMLEIALALVFGYRKKRGLLLIGGVNIVTQICLNVWLNFINFERGAWAFAFYFVVLEILVFITEAVIYCAFLKEKSKRKCTLYAFCANLMSYIAGLVTAMVVPGIF